MDLKNITESIFNSIGFDIKLEGSIGSEVE